MSNVEAALLHTVAAVVPPFLPSCVSLLIVSDSTVTPRFAPRRNRSCRPSELQQQMQQSEELICVTSENNPRTLKRARPTNRCFQGRERWSRLPLLH